LPGWLSRGFKPGDRRAAVPQPRDRRLPAAEGVRQARRHLPRPARTRPSRAAGTGFVLSNGTVSAPAAFIFATLDGHIEAWSPAVDPLIGNAEDKATVPGAGYTGLAIAAASGGDELFAANFAQGRVDVFDSAFHQVKTARWQFRDPRLPRGYLPFNTQALDGDIFVTYDKADPVTHRQAVGPGLGVVDEFSPDGHLISRITSGGALNAPWGLAIAPASWGHAAGSLLVGNFGDGRITILAKQGHHFAHHVTGLVRDISTGTPFAEPGLWGLLPGTAANGGTGSTGLIIVAPMGALPSAFGAAPALLARLEADSQSSCREGALASVTAC
jgi:uncharacterized protein (TIGR03118 family)